jgi:hypothetical protein
LAPIWRGEDSKVQEMRITAELRTQTGAGTCREIGSHQRRSSTVERERRHEHASVANRHQFLHTRSGLVFQESDRVRPLGRRLPFAVRCARYLGTGGLAARDALCRREVLDLRGGTLLPLSI